MNVTRLDSSKIKFDEDLEANYSSDTQIIRGEPSLHVQDVEGGASSRKFASKY